MPGDVRTGARLGDADAGDLLARDRGSEELRAQLVGAEAGERGRGHVGLHADGHRHAPAARVAERLGHHHRVAVVEGRAAIAFRPGEPEQAELAEPAEHFVRREDPGFLPFVHVRVQFLLDEALDGAAQFLVFLGQLHAGLRY